MNRTLKAVLIIAAALAVFAILIVAKIYIASRYQKDQPAKNADIDVLKSAIKNDSLYIVKDVVYRDSGILIAVENPDKSGTETHFDSKYKLNSFDNINMVYIYQYDSLQPLSKASFDDALMAKGKKMGRFQGEWVAKFIDTTDGSCRPLRKYLQDSMKVSGNIMNEETQYQPESIHHMRVVWKYKIKDSAGTKPLTQITAVVDTAGKVLSAEKN
ncbi:MAG: hypothetical protein JST87_02940 [Bacteroidetes bacterium]|nr:hypothetical protein [Bacteroidota bacterium]MBS1934445.1 hypothetical protein [Bacteroidota bacterium]